MKVPSWSRRFIHWIGRRCIGWFYREVMVLGGAHIPVSGAVLLVGNHPNDLPDVLFGLRTSPRHVRYLATISVVSNWFARKTYEAMEVITVARVRDARKLRATGVDMLTVNRAAAGLVTQAMAEGGVVGVFPQGGVSDVVNIGPLRAGVSQMALDSLDDVSVGDIVVVPFGIQYEAARRPRSDVLVVVGAPISLVAWRAAQRAAGEDAGPAALSHRLRLALLEVTRNAPNWDAADVRDELIAAVAALIATNDEPLLARCAALVHPAQAVATDHASDAPTAYTHRVQGASHVLAQAVHAAGGIGASARDHARLLAALGMPANTMPLSPMRTAVLALPAFAGWVIHLPVFTVVWRLALRLSKTRADLVARAFVPGIQLILLWYVIVGIVTAAFLALADYSPIWIVLLPVVLVAASPRLADAAIAWVDAMQGHRLAWRVRRLPAAQRELLRSTASALCADWQSHHIGRDVGTVGLNHEQVSA